MAFPAAGFASAGSSPAPPPEERFPLAGLSLTASLGGSSAASFEPVAAAAGLSDLDTGGDGALARAAAPGDSVRGEDAGTADRGPALALTDICGRFPGSALVRVGASARSARGPGLISGATVRPAVAQALQDLIQLFEAGIMD